MDIFTFEWHRIFLGDVGFIHIGEIVFRTAFLYLYTLLITRLVGRRRSLGKLTPLEFILVIVLGPAAGGGMIYPNVPLVHAMTVITTIGVLAKIGALLAHRSQIVHRFLEGKPLLVIRDGLIVSGALKKENITEEDIKRELREAGFKNPEEIKRAYLEPDGEMSFFSYEKK